MGYLAVAFGAGLIGLLIGLALARRAPRADAPPPPDQAQLAELAFTSSTTGYAVLDGQGRLLVSNARAVELGVVRAGLIDHRIAAAVGRARVAGEPIDVELGAVEPAVDLAGPRPNPAAVQAVVMSTIEGFVVVSATDETEALRLEAVRRDFVANVSHELKTPVAAIGLLAEAVLDGYDDPEHVQRFAEKLLRESVRLGALVNELITLSRLQGADPLPDLAVLEVDTLVAEAEARSAIVAESAGITITIDAPSGLLIQGDRQMLVTALVNLLANAVHYSAAGSTVSISRRVVQWFRRHRRHRPGYRDRRGTPEPRFRALLPDRPREVEGDRRNRIGTGDRQARRRQPRWIRRAVVQTRYRLDLHPSAARVRTRGDQHRSGRPARSPGAAGRST